jgi:hypothetical protein
MQVTVPVCFYVDVDNAGIGDWICLLRLLFRLRV